MKKTLILFAFILSNLTFSQIQFKDFTLAALQVFAYDSNYDNLIKSLESSEMKYSKETNSDKTETVHFAVRDKRAAIVYSKDKEFIYAKVYTTSNEKWDKRGSGDRIENLKENSFEEHEPNPPKTISDTFKNRIIHYRKNDYPYEFVIDLMRKSAGEYCDTYIFNKKFGTLEKYVKFNSMFD